MSKYKYVYRKSPAGPAGPNGKYELGICDIPRTYGNWCDRRVAEGFWGDEPLLKKIVEVLNKEAFIDNL